MGGVGVSPDLDRSAPSFGLIVRMDDGHGNVWGNALPPGALRSESGLVGVSCASIGRCVAVGSTA